MRTLRTLFEGQQQQRRQSCDDGREQQDAAPAEVVGGQVNKDAGHAGGGHSDIVGQVKVAGVAVEVCGETVLDRNSYQAVGEVRERDRRLQRRQPSIVKPVRRNAAELNIKSSHCEAEGEAVPPDYRTVQQHQEREESRLTVLFVHRVYL